MVVHTPTQLIIEISTAEYNATIEVSSHGVKRMAYQKALAYDRADLIFVVADADESDEPVLTR